MMFCITVCLPGFRLRSSLDFVWIYYKSCGEEERMKESPANTSCLEILARQTVRTEASSKQLSAHWTGVWPAVWLQGEPAGGAGGARGAVRQHHPAGVLPPRVLWTSVRHHRLPFSGKSKAPFNCITTQQQIKICLLQSLIFLVGVSGNLMVVVTVRGTKSLHTTTNCYLVSLALADLITLLSSVPQVFKKRLRSASLLEKNLRGKDSVLWSKRSFKQNKRNHSKEMSLLFLHSATWM